MTKEEIKQAILEILTELPEHVGGIINFSGSVSFNFSGSAPIFPEPTGSEPTGSEPTGSEPTGSEPTGSEPTSSLPDYWYMHLPFDEDNDSSYISKVGDHKQASLVIGGIGISDNTVGGYYWNNDVSNGTLKFDDVDLGEQFTISLWWRKWGASGYYNGMITLGNEDQYSLLWHQSLEDNPIWRSLLRYDVDNVIENTNVSYPETSGDLVHHAIVVDLISRTCKHYVDGILIGTETLSSGDIKPMVGSLWLGSNPLGWNPWARMDDLQIYKTLLSDTDISWIRNNPGQMRIKE